MFFRKGFYAVAVATVAFATQGFSCGGGGGGEPIPDPCRDNTCVQKATFGTVLTGGIHCWDHCQTCTGKSELELTYTDFYTGEVIGRVYSFNYELGRELIWEGGPSCRTMVCEARYRCEETMDPNTFQNCGPKDFYSEKVTVWSPCGGKSLNSIDSVNCDDT